ncbi:alkaline D-peptidase [Maribacter vaceletii]|uniref:Alkaline D-peptidase n=1 Tax=Maribacter vaceletii TaxID=1206816 RepID=A0A495EB13_9FLAO|nr:serine hydrolase domain-containing protein [Maribacter vaceletii]RKR13077.1 alkaline D-peptidase [Maribacter vaceletii]
MKSKIKLVVFSFLFTTSLSFGQKDAMTSLIKDRINHTIESPVHSILINIENDTFHYNEGFGLKDKAGDSVSKNSSFRIASSTKLFVATIILQLQEEGKLHLNDKVSLYLKGLSYLNFDDFHNFEEHKYAQEITIEQLLSHRSGLADTFIDKEEEFFNLVFQNPLKQYSPQEMIGLYYKFNLNNNPHFKPNDGWYYSDVNYVLLGLLIEQIDQKSLSAAIRNRILEPLKMKDTYFEFYEEAIEENNIIQQYVGDANFSNINTSFDWSGGGLVSTNTDLSIFITSLFSLKLINKESLDKMIDVKFTKTHESRYGLGVYEFAVNEHIFYGHFGFYGTFVGYSPKTNTTLSYSISQAKPGFNPYQFISQLLKHAK